MIKNWTFKAACKGSDPELFFPISDVGPGALQVAEAKTVCGRCPVTSDCLAYALDNGLDAGIFGGLTETERRKVGANRGGSADERVRTECRA
jgi:WhiB family transcriptional regulator, redox-sensing transcriptional regulator